MSKNVTVGLDLDVTGLRSQLKQILDALNKLVNDAPEIPIKVDTDGATKELDKTKAQFKKAGEEAGKEFSGGLGSQIKEGLSSSFGNLGSAITGGIIGGGVAAGVSKAADLIVGQFQAVIDKGSEFQSNLASLSAITGVSGADLEKFGSQAKDLASKFGGDATTQIGAFQTILSKFGPDLAKTPEALNTVTESVNVLAKASGLDAKQSVDALTNSMLQFGIDASDPAKLAQESSRFINVLAASAKEGAAEIPDVSAAILQAGVAAKGANLSFEETNAAIQALAVGGKVGSEAGVGLRNVLGLLIKQSGPGAEALQSVGLSVEGLGKTLTEKGLASALTELQSGISKLGSDAEKAAFKATLFGTENASTAGILLDNIGSIEKMTTSLTGTSEATRQAQVNMNTFSGFLDRFQANIGNLQIAIFEGFSKAFTFIADAVSGTVGPALESIGTYLERAWSVIQPILAVIGGVIIAGIVNTINLVAVAWKTVVDIFNNTLDQLVAAFKPVTDAFAELFGANGAIGDGIDIVGIFSDVLKFLGSVLASVGQFISFVAGQIIGFLLTPLKAVAGVVADVIKWFTSWIGKLQDLNTTITVVVDKIGNLVNAIVNFDIGAIKDAILDFGNINADVAKKIAADKAIKNLGDEINKAGEQTKTATDAQAGLNNELDKTGKKDGNKKQSDDAKKLAEELKKAKEALAKLTEEEKKNQEVINADALQSVESRELAKLEIETRYAQESLQREKQALTSTGELRQTQEAIINKKLEILQDQSDKKRKQIEGKAVAEKIKQEEEAAKALTDVTTKFAEERIKTLQDRLANGNVAVADELIKAQRSLIEEALSSQLDAIVQSAPAYKEGAKELQRQLEAGLLDKTAFEKASDALRQNILAKLQALPADTTDAYAQKIKLAYEKSTNEILAQTRAVLVKVNEITKKNKLPTFAESLVTLGDVIKQVNFGDIFGKTSEDVADITEEQDKLIEAVRNGQLTYQEAADQLDALQSKTGETSSKTLEALTAVFQAFASQQQQAFNTALQASQDYLKRNVEINKQLVELEKLKAQELAKLQEDDVAKKLEIEKRYEEAKKQLVEEQKENVTKANELTALSYANLAAAAASSFAGMVLSGENALKAMVLVALDALNSLVPILVAQIIGQSLATNPLLGAVVGAAATATLYALVAAAKAAVSSGFKEGGYTGNVGVNEVAGVVHGKEFVANAQATKKHRGLLEHLNSGKSLDSFPALQSMLQNNNIVTMPITEVQMMRMELTSIRKRLDQMPNGIMNNVGVDVNVGMDTYLYEASRSRMKARNLKG